MNLGVVQGNMYLENCDQTPFVTNTASIPQPGQTLVNSQNPMSVSLPLRPEGVFIHQLEEYHTYSFTVYQATVEGFSPISEAVTQDMPQDGE